MATISTIGVVSRLVQSCLLFVFDFESSQPQRALEWSDNMRAQLFRFDKRIQGQKHSPGGKLQTHVLQWGRFQDWIQTREKRIAVIEFLLTNNNELVAFVIKKNLNEPRVFHIPIDLSQLAQIVNLCIRDIHNYTPGFPSRRVWSDKASILFEPFLDELEDVDALLIVPNELLYYIPLHAVTVRGKPLSFLRPVTFAPSITACMNAGIPHVNGPTQLLADQVAVLTASKSLVREKNTSYYRQEELEGATREVQAVADMLGVQARDATKSNVLSALGRYRYVHIACHGHLDPS